MSISDPALPCALRTLACPGMLRHLAPEPATALGAGIPASVAREDEIARRGVAALTRRLRRQVRSQATFEDFDFTGETARCDVAIWPRCLAGCR